MAQLFSPLKIRETQIRNRIFMSPMCQYSANDGVANEWHRVHYGTRVIGGIGLMIVEATGVSPEGRISPGCLGLWNETQAEALKPIAKFAEDHGVVPAIQLAHAGRKASVGLPQLGGGPLTPGKGGWEIIAPSPISFDKNFAAPREMSKADIDLVTEQFLASAKLARKSGFKVIELHMAHGYLMHEFLSPLSNQRKDEFGGSFENRTRFPLKLATLIRKEWPQDLPLFVRISASDWAEGGWDLSQSIAFVRELKNIGVDFIDCSSGGLVPYAQIKMGPGYQVPFSEGVRRETGILTGAVGMITEAQQAEDILRAQKADAIILARELLRNPYWPLNAAKVLGVDLKWPIQYERAKI